jgi:DNA-binding transcriptional MerR regulator
MGNKLITGLAISVGAGLALAARAAHKGARSAKAGGTLTPVTIRVHTAIPRNEQTHVEATTHLLENPVAEPVETPASLQRSVELAEIKVMIEALDQRSNEMISTVNQRIDDLQSHLPRFIDVKVTSRIREVEERLRTEFQDEQSKTLDAFLSTLEQKVLPRIALVEQAVGAQGAEIGQMRQRIEKTDEALDRVLERIEQAVDAMVTPFPGYANGHVTEINQKAVA